MRGEAMRKVCAELTARAFPLANSSALEFFAREGDWQTRVYAGQVKSLEAWEIDPQFAKGLENNLPQAKIRITDSFVAAREIENKNKFDFIVLDNPQGVYGPDNAYCEHFDALPIALPLLKNQGVLLFNVNRAPFNYEEKTEWRLRRNSFYKVSDSSRFTGPELLSFYRNFFIEEGYESTFSFEVQRNSEYLSYLVFGLKRKTV